LANTCISYAGIAATPCADGSPTLFEGGGLCSVPAVS